MSRAYVPYWEWEDWLNGMWRKCENEDDMLNRCVKFTGNWELYGSWMEKVIDAWPRTMLNSLSNTSVNPRAFVGHCACSLAFNCPEYITRKAWKLLTEKQRIDADAVAQKHVDTWRKKYKNTLKHGSRDVTPKGYRMKAHRTSLTKSHHTNVLLLPF